MKKIISVSIILIMLSATIFCGCNNNKKVLRVGVRSDVANFGYILNDNYHGLEIDLAYEISELLNYKNVELIEVTTENREEKLKNGEVDCIIACFSKTPERMEKFDFSETYYTDVFVIIASVSSLFREVSDLEGTTIGVKSNTTGSQYAKKALNDAGVNKYTICEYDSYEDIVTDLECGKIDALGMDYCMFGNNVRTGEMLVLGGEYPESEFGVATLKGSLLSQKINEAVSTMRSDGTMENLVERWYSGGINEQN